MVVIPQLYPAVTIVHKSGTRYEFCSYQALFSSKFGKSLFSRQYYCYRVNLANSFKFTKPVGFDYRQTYSAGNTYNLSEISCDYLAVDEYGLIIPEYVFYEERYKYIRRTFKSNNALSSWNGVGPVPGIHKRTRYGRAFYRRFSFKPTYHDAISFSEEGEPPVRAKRNIANTPSNWDDIRRKINHGWKEFRNQQYKPNSRSTPSCRQISKQNKWNLD